MKKEKTFAGPQEATRKDVECAFGVLQSKWQLLASLVEMWDEVHRGLHHCSAHPFLPLLPLSLIVFWSVTHVYIRFTLSVQSVKMSIFLADLYSAKHEYIFGVQIIICIQLDFVAACFFVYFEYIQILYSIYTLWLCMLLSFSIFYMSCTICTTN